MPQGEYDAAILPGEDATGDVLEPLPATRVGYLYLFFHIDRPSRWLDAEPMKDNTAECLLSALLKIIWRRGCPRILYTDRGGNLLSLLAHKLYH